MRKTLGICLAASFSLWLVGCGDDDSACTTDCAEADAATTDTDTETETDASTTTGSTATSQGSSSTSSSETEADSGVSTDAGSTSETVADGGPDEDSGTAVETDADVPTTDGGAISADAGDAGDASTADASPPVLSACEQACATQAQKDCEDPLCTLCEIPEVNPECLTEATAYLECVAAADVDADFTCDDDGLANYTGDACDITEWYDCAL